MQRMQITGQDGVVFPVPDGSGLPDSSSFDILLVAIGLFLILFTRRRQRLGDLVAGTIVVRQTRMAQPGPEGLAAPNNFKPRRACKTTDKKRIKLPISARNSLGETQRKPGR